MKRYLNYILILSNVLVFIGIVIELGLFLTWKKSLDLGDSSIDIKNPISQPELAQMLLQIVAIPICSMVASCIVLVFYQWNVSKIIKDNNDVFNIKILNTIKIVAYTSIINFLITGLLGMVACLMTGYDWNARLVLMSVAIGFSGIFGLIIIGFISYLNLRMGFEEIKKNNDKLEKNSETTKSQSKNSPKIDERATSGSF